MDKREKACNRKGYNLNGQFNYFCPYTRMLHSEAMTQVIIISAKKQHFLLKYKWHRTNEKTRNQQHHIT